MDGDMEGCCVVESGAFVLANTSCGAMEAGALELYARVTGYDAADCQDYSFMVGVANG